MALYLGSSEINPVETVEVIKEVPTEQDLTLMGNELRRAYCWSRQENINGMCQLYHSRKNLFSELFNATTVEVPLGRYSDSDNNTTYCIIDGKLYTVTYNTTNIILTQYGTDTDWEKVLNTNIFIKNGNVCSKTGTIYSQCNGAYPVYSSSYYANNNKIYSGSTIKLSLPGNCLHSYGSNMDNNYTPVLIDNHIYTVSINNNVVRKLLDYTITNPDLFDNYSYSGFIFAINDTIYKYTHNTTNGTISLVNSYTMETSVKKVMRNFNCYLILLTNGKLYRAEYNNTAKPTLPTDTLFKDIRGNDAGTLGIGLSQNNILYKLNQNTDDARLVKIYEFESETNFKCNGNGYLSCFIFSSKGYRKTFKYTSQYINEITKSYASVETTNGVLPINSKTNSSITVNGNEYTRDGANDSVFKYIPEDLENHTFTDTDLLQAYLDAGIRQQQNS